MTHQTPYATPSPAQRLHLSQRPPSQANPSATLQSVFPSTVAFRFSKVYDLEFSVPDPRFPTTSPQDTHFSLPAAASSSCDPVELPSTARVGSPVIAKRPHIRCHPLAKISSKPKEDVTLLGSVMRGTRSREWNASATENWYLHAFLGFLESEIDSDSYALPSQWEGQMKVASA